MATPISSPQTYIDEFNAKDYLQTYYAAGEGMLNGECIEFILQNLHETFTKGGVKGDTLLDFGTGPTIHQLLSACEVFDKIIVSDFLEQNCTEIQKWLRRDPDAFDWTHIIKSVCELEGKGEDYEKKAEKLRSKLKEVLKCDALKRNPYDPVVLPPVDCLVSCFCLEGACKDIKSFCEVLKNFKDLIKPGGHLVLINGMNGTYYYVGKTCFSTSMSLNKEELETAIKEAGYQIEKAVYTPLKDKLKLELTDYKTIYLILAHKSE